MSDPSWLSGQELRAWVGLMSAAAMLDVALDDRTRDAAGISHASYGILAMLSGQPDGMAHMHQLALFTGQSQSRLSHAVSRLEADGLVTRTRCPENARYVDARLTHDGRALLERAAPAHVADVRRLVIDRLTPEQIASLATITATVLEGLREAGYPVADLTVLERHGAPDASTSVAGTPAPTDPPR